MPKGSCVLGRPSRWVQKTVWRAPQIQVPHAVSPVLFRTIHFYLSAMPGTYSPACIHVWLWIVCIVSKPNPVLAAQSFRQVALPLKRTWLDKCLAPSEASKTAPAEVSFSAFMLFCLQLLRSLSSIWLGVFLRGSRKSIGGRVGGLLHFQPQEIPNKMCKNKKTHSIVEKKKLPYKERRGNKHSWFSLWEEAKSDLIMNFSRCRGGSQHSNGVWAAAVSSRIRSMIKKFLTGGFWGSWTNG